ncbi:MAG: PmoA family protein [Cyclobacteriaceae bacterium]|nr:PmoA family protein [Cyclobacteriaceae bacterium]
MKTLLVISVLTAFIAMLSCGSGKEITGHIDIEISEFNRPLAIISFECPVEGDIYLEDEAGNTLPVQVDEMGLGRAILSDIKAGVNYRYKVKKSDLTAEKVIIKSKEEHITFTYKSKPIAVYQSKGQLPEGVDSVYFRGGYVHPVYSPSGKIITDDYAWNHLHHHGIWTAYARTVFQGRTPDFWNMGGKKGKVDFKESGSIEEGPVYAVMESLHFYEDLSGEVPVVALNEGWQLKVYAVEGNSDKSFHVFDLKIDQECATDSTLFLPNYHYGGLGFRGHEAWNGEDSTFFLTSAGRTRSDGHATQSDWCHIGGYIDGQLAGISIFSNPANFRHPQSMRIHPNEPFFCYSPSQEGLWMIKPGEKYEARYRFMVYDGDPDIQLIQAMWQDYATPLKVKSHFH